MEHLLQKSKCSIFHNIFKYMIFQKHLKALLWSKGLNYEYFLNYQFKHVFWVQKEPFHSDCSFEYPQHMFLFINKKKNVQLQTLRRGIVYPV